MKLTEENKEQAIAELMQRGDTRSHKMLYDLYSSRLWSICMRYFGNTDIAKDVLQETYISIFNSTSTFHWKGTGSLKAWVTKIAINECVRQIKLIKKDILLTDDENIPDVVDDSTIEEDMFEYVSPQELHELVVKLPAIYRTILMLYVVEQKTHREIAEILGITENLSATRLHRAKDLLSIKIKQKRNVRKR